MILISSIPSNSSLASMADFLETLQVRLQDPAIPWQRVVIALGLGVNAFEGYIGYVVSLYGQWEVQGGREGEGRA
jgi:hypothetical protein